jgi:anti-sigma factor (TIGR02949 family)
MCPRRCEDTVRLLVEYLEHQLPPDIHARLEEHLARCPHCLSQLKTYESTVSLLKTVREEDLPPELRWTLKSFLDRNCGN